MDKTAPETINAKINHSTTIKGEITNVVTTTTLDTPENRFLALTKIKEDLILQLKAIDADLEAAMQTLGVDKMLQDPDTLLVYKIVKPRGTFISFKDIGYVRTKKEGEERGELSAKEAEAAGFVLADKPAKTKKE